MAAGDTYNPCFFSKTGEDVLLHTLGCQALTASLYLPSPSNVKTNLSKSQGPTLKATAPPECEGQM